MNLATKVKCCYQCSKRTEDCHISCPDFAVDKAFANAERDERRAKIKLAADLRDQTFRVWLRKRRKNHGR